MGNQTTQNPGQEGQSQDPNQQSEQQVRDATEDNPNFPNDPQREANDLAAEEQRRIAGQGQSQDPDSQTKGQTSR